MSPWQREKTAEIIRIVRNSYVRVISRTRKQLRKRYIMTVAGEIQATNRSRNLTEPPTSSPLPLPVEVTQVGEKSTT